MKRSWAIIIVTVLLAVVLGLVFFKDKLFGRNTQPAASETDGSKGDPSASAPVFPLKKGSQGEEVRKLQHYLNSCLSYYLVLTPLDEDGVFGAKTEGMCLTVTGSREISQEFYNQYVK